LVEPLGPSTEKQRGPERGLLGLARHLVLVAARLGAEHRATTDPVRGLAAALASLAGALLLPDLLRRAADFAEALGRGVTAAALRELPLHHLPQEVLVDLGTEHGLIEVDRPDALTGDVFDV
jgi:hypothetical protein